MTGPPAGSSRPFTVQDLEGMPDDGRRYELVDGVLLVSPAPGIRHQRIGYLLHHVLSDVCPPEFDVIGGPFAVHFPDDGRNEVQPDVLVGRAEDFTEKAVYERMGVGSYWVIDPEQVSLRVFELDDEGHYQDVAKVAGDEAFEATRPFPVRVVVRELLGRLAG